MNQGKLEVVKQEMTRVNTDILGISELKWTEMGKFDSDDHYIYYCGKESLRRNVVSPRSQQKSLRCSTWVQSQKGQNVVGWLPFRITLTQVYAPSNNAEEILNWQVLWRPTWPSRANTKEAVLFIMGELDCKSRKSTVTWSNRQVWPWSTKWSREKANRVLPREHTGHSKHPLPKTQEVTLYMDITRWSTPKSD